MAASAPTEPIDSVTLGVINNACVNLCREMGTAMMRTSYSLSFNAGARCDPLGGAAWRLPRGRSLHGRAMGNVIYSLGHAIGSG
jgi:hypothetical protein